MTTAPYKGLLPGISRAIREINAQVADLAQRPNDLVFLTGEPGTERALVARLIHQHGGRALRPFVRLLANWKLPPEFSSQIVSANGGTVFVSLIREFPVDMQYTFLELALDRTFSDPLSGESREADVRLILTTTLDPETLFARSPLLPDLREILSRNHIEIPSLRERREDIPSLVRFALLRARETGQSPAEAVDRQVLALFRSYPWPGNAEELLLVAAQAALQATGPFVTLQDLPDDFLNLLPPETVRMARSIGPAPASAEAAFEEEPVSTAVSVSDVVTPVPAEPEAPTAEIRPPTTAEILALVEADGGEKGEWQEIPDTPGVSTPSEPPVPFAAQAAAPPDVGLSKAPSPVPAPPPSPLPALPAAPITPVEAARPAAARGTQEILSLASRLYAQSALLARQMEGPLPPASQTAKEIAAARSALGAQPISETEQELARGLEQILALRRQLAILNRREQDSALTIRDLLQRLELASETAEQADLEVLSGQIAEIDAIIERVTERLPRISEDLQRSIHRLLGKRRQD